MEILEVDDAGETADWLDLGDDAEADDDLGQIEEYDLTSSPNDFNVSTIASFIGSGAVKIPGFQRNYVWDIRRASKLIESLIIGLPVPQVFLYEQDRNDFLVVDGQQRLMTVYYFVQGRFPRLDKRPELRLVFNTDGKIPEELLANDDYFEDFKLRLSEVSPGRANKFNGLKYQTLADFKTQFDLRTIRNIIVKQVRPSGDNSSIYEMFHRLNTGGVVLTPQEVRASLYHSTFYDKLFDLNLEPDWRALLGQQKPDLHMRDAEVLLRGLAVWKLGDRYRPSMVRFLNEFSAETKRYSDDEVENILAVTRRALASLAASDRGAFLTKQQKFSAPRFEAIFAVAAEQIEQNPNWLIDPLWLTRLTESDEFQGYSLDKTTDAVNVKGRTDVAKQLLGQ